MHREPIPGRGAVGNPGNRFEKLHIEAVDDDLPPDDDAAPALRTQFFSDHARSIIARNDSPDVGFETSINVYRGCEHGCIYCYARPTHEYLGFGAGLDFESKIMVKRDAPALLRRELSAPAWKPQVVAMSGVTDCYQPIEGRLRLTRGCLEVLAEFRNPVGIVTKNFLVTRDIDLLKELTLHNAAVVYISVTTLDPELARVMEPRASAPSRRLETISALAQAGIPVGVLTAPIIPGLTEHEIPNILKAAAEAGARFAGYTVVRLPFAVAGLFEEWLDAHFPLKKDKVLGRIRDLRGGRLNDPDFGSRMRGEGIFAEQIKALFEIGRTRAGMEKQSPRLSTAAFRRAGCEEAGQLSLFGD